MDNSNQPSSKIVRKSERVNDYQTKLMQNESLNNSKSPKVEINENGIALFVKTIAWAILAIGFFCGIGFGFLSEYASSSGGFSWLMAILWWVTSIISFAVMLGLGEIISLLNKIYHK
ncbi:MAG: hypothetical protein IK085_04045 [Clostridia bacterium]|nr:hypothetical protein [Clostridia bacterium]